MIFSDNIRERLGIIKIKIEMINKTMVERKIKNLERYDKGLIEILDGLEEDIKEILPELKQLNTSE
jgi:hypothetical protein